MCLYNIEDDISGPTKIKVHAKCLTARTRCITSGWILQDQYFTSIEAVKNGFVPFNVCGADYNAK